MSREIKFRAFIEIESLKLMIDDVVVYPSKHLGCDSDSFSEALPEGWSYDGDNNVIKGPEGKEIELDAIDVFNHEGEWVFFEGIVMQFTGLKDKNGKEIYEGDLLGIHTKHGIKPAWVVEWSNGYGGFRPRDLNRKSPSTTISKHYWRGCEVIGNVHQHPELL